MFSEITTEVVIETFVTEMKSKLKGCKDPHAVKAYKHMGNFALKQLETTPAWEEGFKKLFEDVTIPAVPERKNRNSSKR